jgi:polymerase delta-interacting protein 2
MCILIPIKLLTDPPFGAQETLRAWQKKNHPWLELSDVHKETTENVRVTVIPFYMGCRESQATSVFWVRVCICALCLYFALFSFI